MNTNYVSFGVVAIMATALLAYFMMQNPTGSVSSFSLHGTNLLDETNSIVVHSTEASLTFDVVRKDLSDASYIVHRYTSEYPNAVFEIAVAPVSFVEPNGGISQTQWSCRNIATSNNTGSNNFVKSEDGNQWSFYLGQQIFSVQLSNGRPIKFGSFDVDKFEYDLSVPLTEGLLEFDVASLYAQCKPLNLEIQADTNDDGSAKTNFDPVLDKTCVSSRDICALENIYDPRWLQGSPFSWCQYTCASVLEAGMTTPDIVINCQAEVFNDLDGKSFVGSCVGTLDHGVSTYIVIAGTRTYDGWAHDALAIALPMSKLGSAMCHTGMYTWMTYMWECLLTRTTPVAVANMVKIANQGCLGGVALMGHSLGGSSSSLMALYLAFNYNCNRQSLLVVTCGEPQSQLILTVNSVYNGFGGFQHTRWVAYNGIDAWWGDAIANWTIRDLVPFACSWINIFFAHSENSGGYFGTPANYFRVFRKPQPTPSWDDFWTKDWFRAYFGVSDRYYTNQPSLGPIFWQESFPLHTMCLAVQDDTGYRTKVQRVYCQATAHNNGAYQAIEIPLWLRLYDTESSPVMAHCAVLPSTFWSYGKSSIYWAPNRGLDLDEYPGWFGPTLSSMPGLGNGYSYSSEGQPTVGIPIYRYFLCDQYDMPLDLCVAVNSFGNYIRDNGAEVHAQKQCKEYHPYFEKVCLDDKKLYLTQANVMSSGLFWLVPCADLHVEMNYGEMQRPLKCTSPCTGSTKPDCNAGDEWTCTQTEYMPYPAENGDNDQRTSSVTDAKGRYGEEQMYSSATYTRNAANELVFKTEAQLQASLVKSSQATREAYRDPSRTNLVGTTWFQPSRPVNSVLLPVWNDYSAPGPTSADLNFLYPPTVQEYDANYPQQYPQPGQVGFINPPFFIQESQGSTPGGLGGHNFCYVQGGSVLYACFLPTLGMHLPAIVGSPQVCRYGICRNFSRIGGVMVGAFAQAVTRVFVPGQVPYASSTPAEVSPTDPVEGYCLATPDDGFYHVCTQFTRAADLCVDHMVGSNGYDLETGLPFYTPCSNVKENEVHSDVAHCSTANRCWGLCSSKVRALGYTSNEQAAADANQSNFGTTVCQVDASSVNQLANPNYRDHPFIPVNSRVPPAGAATNWEPAPLFQGSCFDDASCNAQTVLIGEQYNIGGSLQLGGTPRYRHQANMIRIPNGPVICRYNYCFTWCNLQLVYQAATNLVPCRGSDELNVYGQPSFEYGDELYNDATGLSFFMTELRVTAEKWGFAPFGAGYYQMPHAVIDSVDAVDVVLHAFGYLPTYRAPFSFTTSTDPRDMIEVHRDDEWDYGCVQHSNEYSEDDCADRAVDAVAVCKKGKVMFVADRLVLSMTSTTCGSMNAPELLTQRGRDPVMAHDGTGTTQFPDGTQLGFRV